MRIPKKALKIMAKYEEEKPHGGLVQFGGLTVGDAEKLLGMGALDPEDRQNESPTIEEFIGLGHQVPGTTFHGYRVLPEREDEGIIFEGFEMPVKGISEELNADEAGVEKGVLRTWWD